METENKKTINTNSIGYEFSEETNEIIPAYIGFQSELGFAQNVLDNTFFNSKYADLTEVWKVIKEPLINNKLAILQFPNAIDFVDAATKEMVLKNYGNHQKVVWTGNWLSVKVREIMVTTILMHVSGQYIKNFYSEIPEDNSHHARGKAITYARKNTLKPILGITSIDEDGNQIPRAENIQKNKNNKTGKEPQIIQYKSEDPKKESKPEPEENPNYLYDKKRLKRYNIRLNKFDDEYQREHKLISTKLWRSLLSEMNKQKVELGEFKTWLMKVKKVKFFDIPKDSYENIWTTIHNDPGIIIDIGNNQ